MTSTYTESSAPVKQYRVNVREVQQMYHHIEKLEADNARLREALEKIVALENDFESNAAMTAHEWQMFHTARAALQETSHAD